MSQQELDLAEIEAQVQALAEALPGDAASDEEAANDVRYGEAMSKVPSKNPRPLAEDLSAKPPLNDGDPEVSLKDPSAKPDEGEKRSNKLEENKESNSGAAAAAGGFTEMPDAPTTKPTLGRRKKILVREVPDETAKPATSSLAKSLKAVDPDLVKAIVESDKPSRKESSKENIKPKAIAKPKVTAGKLKKADSSREKKPRKKSAFQSFAEEMRPILKVEEANLSMTDMSKRLGELWKEASPEDKKRYEDQAASENAKMMAEAPAASVKVQSRAKSAYQLFCTAHRASVKDANADASFGKVTQLLAQAWKAAGAQEKEKYEKEAQEGAASSGKASPAKAKKGRPRKVKQSTQAEHSDDKDEPTPEEGNAVAPTTVASSDDESDREKCDWNEHPAEAILGMTSHHKLIVKRKGLDLTAYGLVDARDVKRQRIEPDVKAPVSLQMLEDYEEWERRFKVSVKDKTINGALELEDLGRDSLLEACYYLGKLTDKNYPLCKAERGKDVMGKYPVIGLSMVTQRMMELERTKRTAAEKEAASLKLLLSEVQAGKAVAYAPEE